jgi:hypothetical protein
LFPGPSVFLVIFEEVKQVTCYLLAIKMLKDTFPVPAKPFISTRLTSESSLVVDPVPLLEHFNIFCSALCRREDAAGKEEYAAIVIDGQSSDDASRSRNRQKSEHEKLNCSSPVNALEDPQNLPPVSAEPRTAIKMEKGCQSCFLRN